MAKKDEGRLFGGIDVGGTKILTVISDENGMVVSSAKKKTKAEQGFKAVCDRACDTLREAAEIEGITLDRLAAVGAGVPSPVLPDGTSAAAANLPGWKNAPLVRTLEENLRRPCFAENDCNLGTYGEYVFGAGKGSRTLVGFFVGTGLGGGIVFHNELIVGENHMAGELGHVIVREGGRKCGCGHNGCLEAYASKTGMARRIAWEIHHQGRKSVLSDLCPDGNYATIKASLLHDAYRRGDQVAVETLNECAAYLGAGIANMVTSIGPDVVVVGGGVFEAMGKELLPVVKESARQRTWPEASFRDTKILLAGLGDDVVALGAVAHARNCLDRRSRSNGSGAS